MDKDKIIEILKALWRFKDNPEYSDEEIRKALDFAIRLVEKDEYIQKALVKTNGQFPFSWPGEVVFYDKTSKQVAFPRLIVSESILIKRGFKLWEDNLEEDNMP